MLTVNWIADRAISEDISDSVRSMMQMRYSRASGTQARCFHAAVFLPALLSSELSDSELSKGLDVPAAMRMPLDMPTGSIPCTGAHLSDRLRT